MKLDLLSFQYMSRDTFIKNKLIFMQILFILLITQEALASTSTAVLNLVGVIQPVAAISVSDVRSHFDLSRHHTSKSEKIGQVVFKLNHSIEGIYLSSNSHKDQSEIDSSRRDNPQRIQFSKPIEVHFNDECQMMRSGHLDFKKEGLVETCDLLASWSVDLPNLNRSLTTQSSTLRSARENALHGLGGVFDMLITVTLVAQ